MSDKTSFLIAVSVVFGPLVLPIVLAVVSAAVEAVFGGSGEVTNLGDRGTETFRKAG